MIYQNKKYYLIYLVGFFLTLFLPIMAISPWFFPPEWGKSIILKILLSSIILLLLWQSLSDQRFASYLINLYKNQKRIFQLIGLLLLLLALSTIFAVDTKVSLWGNPHRAGGAVMFALFLIFPLILFLIARSEDWQKLLDSALIASSIVVLFAIVQYFNLLPQLFVAYPYRPPSTLSNPDYLAIYLLLLFFINLVLAIQELSRKKILYWINLGLITFGIFVAGSRAAYIGLFSGSLFFLLLFPQKIKKVKMAILAVLVFATIIGLYVSLSPRPPSFIENSDRLSRVYQRFSFSNAISDLTEFRFSGWKVFLQAIKARPLLGWGSENIASGFDRYYDPTVPNIEQTWWDRAHNIFLDIAASYGLPFLLIYATLFGWIFFQLWLIRKKFQKPLIPHALQATLIAYLITLLFGFDSVSTYIILFFILGYCLYIINQSKLIDPQNNLDNSVSKSHLTFSKIKKPAAVTIIVFWCIFTWSYNIKPLWVNAKINKIEDIHMPDKSERCQKQLDAFEKLFSTKSFLDSYVRLKYVDYAQACLPYVYSNERMTKIIEALNYASRKEPNYTRTWLLLGAFTNILAANQEDQSARNNLILKAREYLKKAEALSSGRQEIFIEQAKTYFIQEDFTNMKAITEKCIAGGGEVWGCYWYMGLSEILMSQKENGKAHLSLAKSKGYNQNTLNAQKELAAVYTKINDYHALLTVYLWLVDFEPKDIQYRATLAYIYSKLGEYQKAREEALYIISIEPEMKDQVNDFLRTLPNK